MRVLPPEVMCCLGRLVLSSVVRRAGPDGRRWRVGSYAPATPDGEIGAPGAILKIQKPVVFTVPGVRAVLAPTKQRALAVQVGVEGTFGAALVTAAGDLKARMDCVVPAYQVSALIDAAVGVAKKGAGDG